MPGLAEMIQLRATEGEPVTAGGVTVTPRARALIVRLPVGGFVWNQPTSVLIARDGHTESRPIFDPTMATWLGGLVVGLLGAILLLFALRRKEETLS